MRSWACSSASKWSGAFSSGAGRWRSVRARRGSSARPSRAASASASRELLERITDLLRPWSPPAAALVLKDARLFWRDPAQWIQFMIFFGLLCIYVLNLRNVAFNFQSPFWETMISYLNLAASSLTLSTLTTRFVFPQFSLEGRLLWIVGPRAHRRCTRCCCKNSGPVVSSPRSSP